VPERPLPGEHQRCQQVGRADLADVQGRLSEGVTGPHDLRKRPSRAPRATSVLLDLLASRDVEDPDHPAAGIEEVGRVEKSIVDTDLIVQVA
jgi:hypothetical protein